MKKSVKIPLLISLLFLSIILLSKISLAQETETWILKDNKCINATDATPEQWDNEYKDLFKYPSKEDCEEKVAVWVVDSNEEFCIKKIIGEIKAGTKSYPTEAVCDSRLEGIWIIIPDPDDPEGNAEKCISVTKEEYLQYESLYSYPTLVKCESKLVQNLGSGFLNSLKKLTKSASVWASNKAGWILGARNSTGQYIGLVAASDYVGGMVNLTIGIVVLIFLLIFLKSMGSGSGASKAWNWAFVIIMLAAVVILGSFGGAFNNKEYFLAGAFASLWIFLIWTLKKTASHNAKEYQTGWLDTLVTPAYKSQNAVISFLKGIWYSWGFWAITLPLFLWYTLALSTPIINRFVQIITFEIFMPDSWFIRSFIIAFYVGLLPEAIKMILKHQEKERVYKEKLKEYTGKEISKAMAEA